MKQWGKTKQLSRAQPLQLYRSRDYPLFTFSLSVHKNTSVVSVLRVHVLENTTNSYATPFKSILCTALTIE